MVDAILHGVEDFDDKIHPHQMAPLFMTPASGNQPGWMNRPTIEPRYIWQCLYCDLSEWVTHRDAIKRHWAKHE